jgi:hypothetical protein
MYMSPEQVNGDKIDKLNGYIFLRGYALLYGSRQATLMRTPMLLKWELRL